MPEQRSKPIFDEEEWRRLREMTLFESSVRKEGFQFIAGVDEAGRGPLAGPVVAAACILPENLFLRGIDDSKKLSPKKREDIFEEIVSNRCIYYGIGLIEVDEIDRLNILQATFQAMLLAVEGLPISADYLLVDGPLLPKTPLPAQPIIEGDSRSLSIAAASIIAKVTRDRLMCEYHKKWPEYGFDQHKGYGTPKHLEALQKHGASPIHRRSFAPLKDFHR